MEQQENVYGGAPRMSVGGRAVLSKRDYDDYVSEMIETNKH